MISFDAARALVLHHSRPLAVQSLDIRHALGQYLAEAIIAPFAAPRFDNSAVDGYGVRLADVENATNETPAVLRLAGVSRAGHPAQRALRPGEALKIMTGAPVPQGVEAIIMREYCEERENTVALCRKAAPGENIRREAGEFQAGQTVLRQGDRITPPVVALLSAFGITQVLVHTAPRVSILSSGDELVTAGERLAESSIYDSNLPSLSAACRGLGISPVREYRVPDDPTFVTNELRSAAADSDVVITIGGVSVGDFDYVRDALEVIDATVHFTKVAMKPGKPNVFATYSGDGGRTGLIFGLPGNPVSALISFHHFVRPSLLGMMGSPQSEPLILQAVLQTALAKKPGRLEFVRARLATESGQPTVQPTAGQDSQMLGGLSAADCLIHFPADARELSAGQTVSVELLSW